jgi:hypothetical protein
MLWKRFFLVQRIRTKLPNGRVPTDSLTKASSKSKDPSGGPCSVIANLENAHEIQAFAILDLAGSSKFGVNDVRTCGKIDTPLTRQSSRSVLTVDGIDAVTPGRDDNSGNAPAGRDDPRKSSGD